jgi:hypothetical protein
VIILGQFVESGNAVKVIKESTIGGDSTLMTPDPDLSSNG